MPPGFNIRKIGIAGSLVLIAAGAFVLGHALTDALRAPPAKPAAFARPSSPAPVAQVPAVAPQVGAIATLPAQAVVAPHDANPAQISPAQIGDASSGTPGDTPVVSGVMPPNAQNEVTSSPAPAAGMEPRAASTDAGASAQDRRMQARKLAAGHWTAAQVASTSATAPAEALEPSVTAPPAAASPPAATGAAAGQPADKAISAPPDATRSLGFLAQVKDLPEAIAAIEKQRDESKMAEVAAQLDQLIPTILENRSNPASWSNLADALARAGQRSAAIAVANRGMNAAKRQQDGEAVTRLTQQLAQLELTGAQPATVPAPASAKAKGRGPAAVAAAAVASAATAPVPSGASPEHLSAALDEALRRSAATEALAILQQMADGSIARGDYAAALKAYNDAIQIAHIQKLTEVRADQYANVGRLHWKKGDKAEAEAFWRAARDQYEQFEITTKVAEMNALLAKSSPGATSSPSRPMQNGKRTTSFYSMR